MGRNRPQHDTCIFDSGRDLSPNPNSRIGLGGVSEAEFRRTDSDRKPPRKVVTREILGDPMPGRTPWAAK